MVYHLTSNQLMSGNVPRTTCLKCKKLVDVQSIYYSTQEQQYTILVQCHKEWERKKVHWNVFEGFEYEGTAFEPETDDTLPAGVLEGEFSEVSAMMKPGLPVPWQPSLDLEGQKLITCCNGGTGHKPLNQPSAERAPVQEWAPLMKDSI